MAVVRVPGGDIRWHGERGVARRIAGIDGLRGIHCLPLEKSDPQFRGFDHAFGHTHAVHSPESNYAIHSPRLCGCEGIRSPHRDVEGRIEDDPKPSDRGNWAWAVQAADFEVYGRPEA